MLVLWHQLTTNWDWLLVFTVKPVEPVKADGKLAVGDVWSSWERQPAQAHGVNGNSETFAKFS